MADDERSESGADTTTSSDRDDLLLANRENRAKARAVHQAREAKRQAKAAKRAGVTADQDVTDQDPAGQESAGQDPAGQDPTDQAASDDESTTDPDRVPRKLTAPARGERRYVVALAALSGAVVALAVLAGYFGYRYHEAGDQLDRTDLASPYAQQAMTSARDYAATIATYNPSDYGDLDRRIRAIATPGFADRYIQASHDARKGNTSAKGTSKAESKEAGLESLTGDTAVVLVTLDQVVTSPDLSSAAPGGIPYQSRVKVTLSRDGDRWLISDLETV